MNSPEKRKIFRRESLNYLSTPERLDELIKVISPQDWIPLVTLGGLVLVGLVWSIFGRIPITVAGQGVLLRSRQVVELQSPISGQLQELKVKEGDCLPNPQGMIATIEPLELKQKRELEMQKLAELQKQDREASAIALQKNQLEKIELNQQKTSLKQRLQDAQSLTPLLKNQSTSSITKQGESLKQRLQNLQSLTPVLRSKRSGAIQQKRESLQQRLQDAKAQAPVLKERLEIRQELAKQGAIPKDQVLEAERQYRDSLQNVAEVQAQLKQLDVDQTQAEQAFLENLNSIGEIQSQLKKLELDKTEAEQRYVDNLNKISEIGTQLNELDTKAKTLEQQNLDTTNNRKNQILEVENQVKAFDQQIQINSVITSPYEGCILELTVTNGQVVSPGSRIGSIQIQKSAQPLLAVTYFAVRDGKQIKPGMPIQITPSLVKRERFGGIVGNVVSVSPFPVTKQGAASTIGNPEIVESLLSQSKEAQIEVWAELKENPRNFSGYEWSSSQGPLDVKMSTGTTTSAQVTVQQRAPIEFVLPFLREWSGIK
ncbi:NHLP bacteriocin system secretion protein [Phormidium sp. LEGE 05292]|uniref:NHLP bacteriocin system secretion protein n=1 Tax=[Phormidium] sp. LEGE 05292 TaxID=767427 RepID=UPI001882C09B|nr:NHLP bacteriocin system secretion protein [Phormidium sp. LEGE 05292]MBE9224931.1 NHLP bacteriocin system secretion protein [Phormidium sp. LEGE 05292]